MSWKAATWKNYEIGGKHYDGSYSDSLLLWKANRTGSALIRLLGFGADEVS
jgi:hypothetical protein